LEKENAKKMKELREKNKKAMRQIRAYLRRLCLLAQEWHDANPGHKKKHAELPPLSEGDVDEICELFGGELEKLQSVLDAFGELENKAVIYILRREYTILCCVIKLFIHTKTHACA
jgi:hypothetical protein